MGSGRELEFLFEESTFIGYSISEDQQESPHCYIGHLSIAQRSSFKDFGATMHLVRPNGISIFLPFIHRLLQLPHFIMFMATEDDAQQVSSSHSNFEPPFRLPRVEIWSLSAQLFAALVKNHIEGLESTVGTPRRSILAAKRDVRSVLHT